MAKTLHISINNKIATYNQRDGGLVCGNNDYQIEFTFDSEWDDLPTKTARFIWNGQYEDVVFTGTTCTVPVVNQTRRVAVGVYAGNLSTTTPAYIEAKESILCSNPTHNIPRKDVYNQIIDLLESMGGGSGGGGDGHTHANKTVLDTLTADKVASFDQVLLVTGTAVSGTAEVRINNTADGIISAYKAGKIVVLDFNGWRLPLTYIDTSSKVIEFQACELDVPSTGYARVIAVANSKSNITTWGAFSYYVANQEDIPTTLPNPNALTFTGAVTGTYDGSEAVEINIPEGSSGSDIDAITELYADAAGILQAIYSNSGLKPIKDVNDKSVKIPTKNSQLENDSGYLTEHQDLSGYAKKSDIPTSEIDANTQARHEHENKDFLDTLTEDKINSLDQLFIVVVTSDATTATADRTAAEIYEAYTAGKTILCRWGRYVLQLANCKETAGAFAAVNSYAESTEVVQMIAVWYSGETWNVKKNLLPTENGSLKNPNALTFTGAVTGSYDGSSAMTVNIPESGSDETPSDIATACDSIIENVRAVLKSDSIISLTMSDAHQLSSGESGADNVRTGNTHAGIAARYLAKRIPLTFAAFLGDYTTGHSATTTAQGKAHFSEINDIIADAFEGVPNFRTVGNHDDLHSSSSVNGSNLPTQTTFSYIGAWNRGAVYGDSTNGYCYRDFEDRKLRVICLNTNDGNTGEAFTSTQQTWFKNVLKEVGAKTNWNVIILSHHPLDWGGVCSASNIVYSYVNGSGDFSGSNNAKILLAIHGHVHCFKYDKLNYISNSTGTPYDVYRMATPNMCFNRNNEYGTNGKTEYYNIEFGETTTYDKTAGGTQDTAFTINVINPTDETVYSFCYGAGYDREFSIAQSTIAVTGVSVSPTSLSLEVNDTSTLTATVSPSNATNKSVSWTSSAPTIASVSNGVVTALAEGSATITATTNDGSFTATCAVTVTETATPTPSYTNIVPTLVDSEDTSQVFNGGLGYKNGAYASSMSPGYGSDSSFVCTGLIPTKWSSSVNTTWYIKGVEFNGASHSRLAYGTPKAYSSVSNVADGTVGWNMLTVTKLGDKYYKVVQNGYGDTQAALRGWWFSAVGSGENLIVTKDEPIE